MQFHKMPRQISNLNRINPESDYRRGIVHNLTPFDSFSNSLQLCCKNIDDSVKKTELDLQMSLT